MFDVKPRLVTDPVMHAAQVDKLLWSICEIKLFLEHFLISPKDFEEIALHLPNKSVPQLIQFYYDFKKLFALDKYITRHVTLDRCYRSLATRRKDKRIPLQSVARNVYKT